MQKMMLAPAAALVLWSITVMLWMVLTRMPALRKAGINLAKVPPGGRGEALNGVLPEQVMWKAHNYVHLMEQPTIFYPAVLVLAIAGASPIDVWLAWAYVALRVSHSLWQSLINTIPVRFALFFLSTLALIGLALRACYVVLA